MSDPAGLPLETIRVVDLADRVGEAAARLLADLGAETIKVEPASGAASRSDWPLHGGRSLGFAMRNANKRSVVLDAHASDGRESIRSLVSTSDLVFLTPAMADLIGLDDLVSSAPHLVAVVSSPFGRSGPRRGWQATERTLYALSGLMSRSGKPGATPLLPPSGLSDATASTQAAWVGLVGVFRALGGGGGQVIDLSHHESVVTGLDPAFGVQGSAAAGRSGKVRRDRPPADSYPIYPCADGHVRLCLLAKRQWRGMFGWLGEPAEFADPKYDTIAERVGAAPRLDQLIVELFASSTGADLVEEAARRGVPLAQVLSLGEALDSDHFTAAGTVAKAEIATGLVARVPIGCIEIGGRRLGIRNPSPDLDPSEPPTWHHERERPAQGTAPDPGLPFSGLRVLDLGVIVFGAELGRAFADLGADVIKVESLSFPDGLRQTRGGEAMNASFAWGQRNKRSLGLDIRTPEGHAMFLDLAASSDVVVSNFKPGTLSSLGIGHDALCAVNPDIVVLESAAFSSQGPWARRLGYGPLVRAACGLSSLWRYGPDQPECWDGVTVFPDHVAARVAALSILSQLIARKQPGGRGQRIEVAQSDVVLHQLGALAALEALEPGSATPVGNRGRELFGGVYACSGDDEWCVVEARDERELGILRAIVAGSDDVRDLDAAVAGWTAGREPAEVMATLQAAGIPAGAMIRLPDLLDDPQLRDRGTFVTMHHPVLGFDLPAESPTGPFRMAGGARIKPAPAVGENTWDVCSEVLGISRGEYEQLLANGVVHEGIAR